MPPNLQGNASRVNILALLGTECGLGFEKLLGTVLHAQRHSAAVC